VPRTAWIRARSGRAAGPGTPCAGPGWRPSAPDGIDARALTERRGLKVSSNEPILRLRGINKSFGPVSVLKGVDFEARSGEVTALVGDNGAGKSTLVKCIGGTYSIDGGDYVFDGKPIRVGSPKDASTHGIEIVYQDLALCENLDIVQNMFLGRELITKRSRTLDESTMERMAGEALASLSVRTVKSVRQKVSSLSGGQRQSVAIAKSVLWNSKVVILDEPTAALGVAQTAEVLRLVRDLADKGVAVILISHNMNDVLHVADRIAALYLGQMAAIVDRKDVNQQQLVELITTGRSGDIGIQPAAMTRSAS
jgi:D-xylose transport system ATP-binding protein